MSNQPEIANDRARESRLRRKARRLDHVIYKSRVRNPHMNDHGGYMLCNDQNIVVEGAAFELNIDALESWLSEIEKKRSRHFLGNVMSDAKAVNENMASNRNSDERIESKIRDLIERTFKGSEREAALDWLERRAVGPR